MRRWLLLLGLVVSLAAAMPARAQYIFMDVNGDGQCTFADVLATPVPSVDIYLDTNHDANGTLKTCAANAAEPLDIFSYDLVVHYSGPGAVTFQSYTNAASGFTQLNALTVAGQDAGVGYTAPIGGNLAPGLYKLGTFDVTVTGNPVLTFVGLSSNPSIPSFGTGFGTSCDASDFGNTEVLGTDFFDSCGLLITDDIQATTWGKIKQIYR